MNSSTGTSRQPVQSIVTQDADCRQYQECVVVFVYSDCKCYFVCLLTVNDYRAVVFIFLGISVAVSLWRVAAALVVRKTSGKTRQTPQMKNNLTIKLLILTNATTLALILIRSGVSSTISVRGCPVFYKIINFNDKIKGRQQVLF